LQISLCNEGLSFPTSISFVNNKTMMVLEKYWKCYACFVDKLQRALILKLSDIANNPERCFYFE
jgi:hypothetical protein